MTVRLEDTTASEVASAIASERHRLGASASGMVMTLIIIADEENQNDATMAASHSAGEHPCRIITVIPRPGREEPRLDAGISIGDNDGPGELVRLRLRGALSAHAHSVVLPLLLSDTPVVAWWPAAHPVKPSADPLGKLATRRIIDTASDHRPLVALATMKDNLVSGDTDLAWTRLTPWRSALAAVLDQPYDAITRASVRAQNNPSAPLLRTWLQWRLGVPVAYHRSKGPGINEVVLHTQAGDVTISRHDGTMAQVERLGTAVKELYLPRRGLQELITEELRRLDPDEPYEHTMGLLDTAELKPTKPEKRLRSRKKAVGTKATGTKAAGTKATGTKSKGATKAAKKVTGKKPAGDGAVAAAERNAENAADRAIDNQLGNAQ